MNPQPKASDRAALVVTILLGLGAAAVTVVQAVFRIVQIVPNRNIPVTASFADTPTSLPIGPSGADVPVVAQQVVFEVSNVVPIVYVSLILAEVVYAVAVLITVTCACLVIRNLMLGRAFVPANLGLISTATFAVAFGWLFTWLFRTMGANGASAAISSGNSSNTAFGFEPMMIFAIAALGALTVAFQLGGRLQKETEGLV